MCYAVYCSKYEHLLAPWYLQITLAVPITIEALLAATIANIIVPLIPLHLAKVEIIFHKTPIISISISLCVYPVVLISRTLTIGIIIIV